MSVPEEIAEWLHAEYGFDSAHLGEETLLRVIRDRTEATGIPAAAAYLEFLRGSPGERQAFFECVTVPETYFFRHPEAFAALVDWARTHESRPLRILSMACSTGEEPYSIAMALEDAGLSPGDFSIEACDMSARALAHARAGRYGLNSFRTNPEPWRSQYFLPEDQSWRIHGDLRAAIQFRQANILELKTSQPWDAIFCRNVIIYFSPERQTRLINFLDQSLAPSGMLFLGPAEPPLFLKHGWKSAPHPMSFACRRAGSAPPLVPPRIRHAIPTPKPAFLRIPERAAPEPPRPSAPSIEQAEQLAGAGRLGEARALLEKIFTGDPSDAAAYYLSGVLAEAEGREELAESHYRKALYLEPNHAEALQHMALLLRRQGREQAAENLERRAHRHSPA